MRNSNIIKSGTKSGTGSETEDPLRGNGYSILVLVYHLAVPNRNTEQHPQMGHAGN